MKVGQNFLIKNESPLSNLIGQENITYYTARQDEFTMGSSASSGKIFSYNIVLDDVITTT